MQYRPLLKKFTFNWPEEELIVPRKDNYSIQENRILQTKLQLVAETACCALDFFGFQDWKFKFDKGKKRAGYCSWSKKTISLSMWMVAFNNWAEIQDTILHEIAHALTPGHHHDAVWQKTAVIIGASPSRCYDSNKCIMPQGKIVLRCDKCGSAYRRHRRPRRPLACTKCCDRFNGGEFDSRFLLELE